eukprot:c739_g1_i1.p1 GENE.c739_g1_i1~~c739_g1_i1.p1  ORF type:complete len:231 (+),score=67.82 c739_g1_i1:74-694(+)
MMKQAVAEEVAVEPAEIVDTDGADASVEEPADSADSTEPAEPKLKFRNYTPHDKTIDFEIVKAPLAPDLTKDLAPIKESVRKLRQLSGVEEKRAAPAGFVRDSSQQVVEQVPKFTETETPLVELAPKKANWDLKRDVTPKLEKLKHRTDKAIMEMLRQKVLAEQRIAASADEVDARDDTQQGDNFVSSINSQSKVAAAGVDSDDDD